MVGLLSFLGVGWECRVVLGWKSEDELEEGVFKEELMEYYTYCAYILHRLNQLFGIIYHSIPVFPFFFIQLPDSVSEVILAQLHPVPDHTVGTLAILINLQVDDAPAILGIDADFAVLVHGECVRLAILIEVQMIWHFQTLAFLFRRERGLSVGVQVGLVGGVFGHSSGQFTHARLFRFSSF